MLRRLLYISFLVLMLPLGTLHAQGVLIGKKDGATNPYAKLEIYSTSSGLLIPRLTTEQREDMDPDETAVSLLVYDTDINGFMFFNGDEWEPILSGVGNQAVQDLINGLLDPFRQEIDAKFALVYQKMTNDSMHFTNLVQYVQNDLSTQITNVETDLSNRIISVEEVMNAKIKSDSVYFENKIDALTKLLEGIDGSALEKLEARFVADSIFVNGAIININNQLTDLDATVKSNYNLLDNRIYGDSIYFQSLYDDLKSMVGSDAAVKALEARFEADSAKVHTEMNELRAELLSRIDKEVTDRTEADEALQTYIDDFKALSEEQRIVIWNAVTGLQQEDILLHQRIDSIIAVMQTGGYKSWSGLEERFEKDSAYVHQKLWELSQQDTILKLKIITDSIFFRHLITTLETTYLIDSIHTEEVLDSLREVTYIEKLMRDQLEIRFENDSVNVWDRLMQLGDSVGDMSARIDSILNEMQNLGNADISALEQRFVADSVNVHTELMRQALTDSIFREKIISDSTYFHNLILGMETARLADSTRFEYLADSLGVIQALDRLSHTLLKERFVLDSTNVWERFVTVGEKFTVVHERIDSVLNALKGIHFSGSDSLLEVRFENDSVLVRAELEKLNLTDAAFRTKFTTDSLYYLSLINGIEQMRLIDSARMEFIKDSLGNEIDFNRLAFENFKTQYTSDNLNIWNKFAEMGQEDIRLNERIDSIINAYAASGALIADLTNRFMNDSIAKNDSIALLRSMINSIETGNITINYDSIFSKIYTDSLYFASEIQVLRDSLGKLDQSELLDLEARFEADSAQQWNNLDSLFNLVLDLKAADDNIRAKAVSDSIYFEGLIASIQGLDAAYVDALEIRFLADSAALRDSLRNLVSQDSAIYQKIFADSTYFAYYIDSIANRTLTEVLAQELEIRFMADSAAKTDSIILLRSMVDSLGIELIGTQDTLFAKIFSDSTYFENEIQQLRDSIGNLDQAALLDLEARFEADSAQQWNNLDSLFNLVLDLKAADDSIRAKAVSDSIYFENLIAGIEGLDPADLEALEIRFESDSASLRDSIRMLVSEDSSIYQKIYADSTYFAYYIDSIADRTITEVLAQELEIRFMADSAAKADSIILLSSLIDSLSIELTGTKDTLFAKLFSDSAYFESEIQQIRDSLGNLDQAALLDLEARFVADSTQQWLSLDSLFNLVLNLKAADDSIRAKAVTDSIYFENLIAGIEGLDPADLEALEIRFESDSAALRDSVRMLVSADSVTYQKVLSDSLYFQQMIDSLTAMVLAEENLKKLESRFVADSAALRDSIETLNYLIDSIGLALSAEDQLIYQKILGDSTYAHFRIDSLIDAMGTPDSTLFKDLELRFEAESIHVWSQFELVSDRFDSIILWNKELEARILADSLLFDSLIENIDAVDTETFERLVLRFETDSMAVRDSFSYFVKADSSLYAKIVSDSTYFEHLIDSLIADVRLEMIDSATFYDSIAALKDLIASGGAETKQTTKVVADMAARPTSGTILGDVVIVEDNGAGYREVFIWADTDNNNIGDRWESTEKSALGSGYSVYWFKLPTGISPTDISLYTTANMASLSASSFDSNGYLIQTGEDFSGKYVFAYPEAWGKPQFTIRDYPLVDGTQMYTLEINGIKYQAWTVYVSMTADYLDNNLRFKALN